MLGPRDLRIPESLETQLLNYRRRVWSIKLFEAFAIAVLAVCVGFFSSIAMDRSGDAPGSGASLGVACRDCSHRYCPVVCLSLGLATARLRATSRLAPFSRKLPTVGDSLLGVLRIGSQQNGTISLTRARSSCRFVKLPPMPRNEIFLLRYQILDIDNGACWPRRCWRSRRCCLSLFQARPPRELARLAAPWGSTPRYTFTRVELLPDNWFVAHGEPLNVNSWQFTNESQWTPAQGTIQVGSQQPVTADLVDGKYPFVIPPQIESQTVCVTVGDAEQTIDSNLHCGPSWCHWWAAFNCPSICRFPTV